MLMCCLDEEACRRTRTVEACVVLLQYSIVRGWCGLLERQVRVAGVWLHGEAVAAGMVMAADMSHRLGWIDQDILDRTRRLLQRANLPVAPPSVRFFSCSFDAQGETHRNYKMFI